MRWIFGSTIGSIFSIVVISVLTIMADLEPKLKDWLKETFAHHWVGKGILALIVFVVVTIAVSAIAKKISEEKIVIAVKVLGIVTILSALVLIAFFLFETFV